MSLFYSIFFIIVLAIILISLIYFVVSTDKYVENLQYIRKLFYVIFVAGVGIGIILGEIALSEWQTLLILATLFVFVDLAVFQTPDILKIWNTEFQQVNYVKRIIRKNDEIIGKQFGKVLLFTQIIDETSEHFRLRNKPTHWRQYKDELRTYLNLYADALQFHVSIFEFETTTDENLLKSSVANALQRVQICYNKTIEDAEWKEGIIKQLVNGTSIELKNKNEETDFTIFRQKTPTSRNVKGGAQ